jgi:hypothetical protein
MFDKFGEMSSYTELNEIANNLVNEGDMESLREMAAENGIPEELVGLYLNGDIPELCDALTAAIGKLDVECEKLKPKEIMEDWVEYIRTQCLKNDLLARQVRKKGKNLEGCIAELLKWSFGHQTPVDAKIMKAAGVTAGRCTLGIPGMATAKKLILQYYMEK